MNSVNFFSAFGTPDQSPLRNRRSASESSIARAIDRHHTQSKSKEEGDSADESAAVNLAHPEKLARTTASTAQKLDEHETFVTDRSEDETHGHDETTPLLDSRDSDAHKSHAYMRENVSFVKRLSGAFVGTFRIIISIVLAPGRFLISFFHDEEEGYSVIMPIRKMTRAFSRKDSSGAQPMSAHAYDEKTGATKKSSNRRRPKKLNIANDAGSEDSSRGASSDDTPARNTRSRAVSSASSISSSDDDDNPAKLKRSIRINLADDEALRQRQMKRESTDDTLVNAPASSSQPILTVDTIKSPISPTSPSRLTRYPRLPAPPRPLVPRRQPSYRSAGNPIYSSTPQKTLVLDLDETLIHSMAKGGRMSTGHMVEVKLQSPVGTGGQVIGPQVPILYYVHKRPFCDEFLRKVSKWFNLVIFTASVQEYADPVIDWLELERKYFSARYYRQHCTFRNGAYIKDLSSVEPDLSKVMILDNSPMSYIFHEDNAIPIEGWISDPTDNDLLHLVPLLEGLQHVTDVRALLALRLGESTAAL